MFDIDDLKAVNDTYKHPRGDAVLRHVARVLQENSREADSPARYGGEELSLILPHTDLEGAHAIAERIRTAIEALRVARTDGRGVLRVTASLGVAASTDGRKEALIADADGGGLRGRAQRQESDDQCRGSSRGRFGGRVGLSSMGLLDDAIREHLDLKRRRGADPTEIERAEREALGPVRRGPEVRGEEAPPVDSEVGVAPEASLPPAEDWEPFPEDDEHEPTGLREPVPTTEDQEELPSYEPAEPVEREPLAAPPPFDAETESAPPTHPADMAPAPEPETHPAPHPAEPPAHLDQETEEYELEAEEEEGDDVLESTPEFLQDAPDHDRLWFEQRPPRDFDFDG